MKVFLLLGENTKNSLGFGQQDVFDKFYKIGEPRHGMESTGLGLAICKSIVERHSGKIWAESPGPGKGSTFHFTLSKKQNIPTVAIKKDVQYHYLR